MAILIVGVTVVAILCTAFLISEYRRHRPGPAAYHVIMAEHVWQPRKRR